MTEKIHLRTITRANYLDIIKLKVHSDQEHLVASNLYTIAQMQFKHEKTALGIYFGETPVGLIAYDLDDYDIWRLMIDRNFQRRGFGTQAMKLIIEILRNHGKLPKVRTSAIISDNGPKPFYERLGFMVNGNVLSYKEDGTPNEIEMIHTL